MSDHLLPHDAALERLRAYHPIAIDLSLGRVQRLLEALRRPQDRLPPVVHVAGTNGKGSTVALLRAMAEADGRRVHVFTSPHLVRFAERIRLAGTLISEARLADVVERVEHANAGGAVTFFEMTTAVALLAFAETPADLVLLEVGLGGRWDSTNVVDRPELSLITPVDLDHQHFLGDTIERIAFEKAGIVKAGRPVIVGRQRPEALAVIAAEATRLGAPLSALGDAFELEAVADRLTFRDATGRLEVPPPSLSGAHQRDNAALAVAAARALGVSDRAIAAGVTRATHPARLQRLTAGPLAAVADANGAELWLDGAHNPHGARALAAWLAEIGQDGRRPVLVAGLLVNKDAAGFLKAFAELSPPLVAPPFAAAAALPPEALAGAAREAGLAAQVASDISAAVDAAARKGGRVVICGSLYLAGQALSLDRATWPG